ncbi:MAG TPA: hypothetical protein VFV31_03200 [Chitinophagaceae bacterium]|nr:hypothetical protein [Chitinophagaceae bacterium]
MTKDELLKAIEENTQGPRWWEGIVTAVDAYSLALIAAKPIVSGSLPPMVEIEFGNHLYAKIDLQDGVKVLNVVNGWGDKVDLDLVKVKAAMTV